MAEGQARMEARRLRSGGGRLSQERSDGAPGGGEIDVEGNQ